MQESLIAGDGAVTLILKYVFHSVSLSSLFVWTPVTAKDG